MGSRVLEFPVATGGTLRVDWMFTLTAAAYDLIRLPKLLDAAA